jgi:hypothetical protein
MRIEFSKTGRRRRSAGDLVYVVFERVCIPDPDAD